MCVSSAENEIRGRQTDNACGRHHILTQCCRTADKKSDGNRTVQRFDNLVSNEVSRISAAAVAANWRVTPTVAGAVEAIGKVWPVQTTVKGETAMSRLALIATFGSHSDREINS